MIPLGTDRPLSRTTIVTFALIAVNVVLYLIGVTRRPLPDPEQVELFGPLISKGADPIATALRFSQGLFETRPWTAVTYAFVHADFWHIFGNMLVLWVFGPNVEDRLGRIGFLLFYLIGAAVAAGAHAMFSVAPVIGASGAVAAVTGAYVVLFPRTNIKCLIFLVFIGIFQIPAPWFIAIAIARDLVGIGVGGRVAYEAHIAGYLYGGVVAFILLATGILKREQYDLFQIFKHKRRLAEFRSAAQEADQSRKDRRDPSRGAPPAVVSAIPEEALQHRARVNAAIASSDLPAAATLYRELCLTYATIPSVTLLSRPNMLAMGNHLFASGAHAEAAAAYEKFLAGYPSDGEVAHVKLMLGLLKARYLSRPAEAKPLLVDAAAKLTDEQHAALARELLQEIDAPRV